MKDAAPPEASQPLAWKTTQIIHGEDGDNYKIELYDSAFLRAWRFEYHDGDDDEGDTGLFISEAVLIQLADRFKAMVDSLYFPKLTASADRPVIKLLKDDEGIHFDIEFDSLDSRLLLILLTALEEASRNIKCHLNLSQLR